MQTPQNTAVFKGIKTYLEDSWWLFKTKTFQCVAKSYLPSAMGKLHPDSSSCYPARPHGFHCSPRSHAQVRAVFVWKMTSPNLDSKFRVVIWEVHLEKNKHTKILFMRWNISMIPRYSCLGRRKPFVVGKIHLFQTRATSPGPELQSAEPIDSIKSYS